MTKIKICGLRRDEDIAIVNDYLPDYAGFIIDFPASFRSLSHEEVKNLTARLEKKILPVGVFVDEPVEIVIELLKEGVIGAAQLHGNESPEYIMKVQEATGKPVIKSFVLPKGDGLQNQDSQGFQSKNQRSGQEDFFQKDEEKRAEEYLRKSHSSDIPIRSGLESSVNERNIQKDRDDLRWRAEEVLKAAEASPADMILLDAGNGSGQTFNWDLLTGFSRPYFLAGGISENNIRHAINTLHPYAVDISSSVETDRFKDRQKVKNIIELARKGSTK